jgi:3-oxoadipate enol-lactonase / 4-carboxymuconolactone decarboxylase
MTAGLHYVVEGRTEPDAPVLLLIHPLGGELAIWGPVMPLLRSRFRVVRYDLRGHGRTPAPPGPYTVEALGKDAIELLDRLAVERAAVCGTSIGGMIAMWLGANAQSRVSSLALLCTSARLAPPEAWHERAALVREQGTQAVAEASLGRWFTPKFAARRPDLAERARAMIGRASAEGYAGCCEAIASWDFRDQLARIQARTCIVAGGRDPVTPPSHAYALGAAIPIARVTVLEQTAHLALAEQPERVAQLLLAHLDPGAPDRDRSSVGERIRREVLGDVHVDRAQAAATEFSAPFQALITEYAWGEIWNRPGLSRAERSLITLSVLATLRHDEEFVLHVSAALRNGVSVEQLRELLMQLAIYAGVPSANHAFALAQKALESALQTEIKKSESGGQ